MFLNFLKVMLVAILVSHVFRHLLCTHFIEPEHLQGEMNPLSDSYMQIRHTLGRVGSGV